jgi:hypothetical protein
MIVLITHDECVFSANDGKRQAWLQESDAFLRPKGKGQGIMVSDFLLPWGRLNLLHLTEAKLAEAEARNIPPEAVELFEYGRLLGRRLCAKILVLGHPSALGRSKIGNVWKYRRREQCQMATLIWLASSSIMFCMSYAWELIIWLFFY